MSKISHKDKYLELVVILDEDNYSQEEAENSIDQIKSPKGLHVGTGSPCPITLSASSVHLVQFQSGDDVCTKTAASTDDSSNDTASIKLPLMPLSMLVVPDTTDDTKQESDKGTKTEEKNNYNTLLEDIHPSLATYFSLVGIIQFSGHQNESEISIPKPFLVLLLTQNDLTTKTNTSERANDYWDQSQQLALADYSFANPLPIADLQLSSQKEEYHQNFHRDHTMKCKDDKPKKMEIPSCPICLYRIQPECVGISSMHIAATSATSMYDSDINLLFWSQYCPACNVMLNQKQFHTQEKKECFECGMKETLWVCLTCGIAGCGRYSGGHAGDHYQQQNHPYSLELATGRIWDYSTDSFVHRTDLPGMNSTQYHHYQHERNHGRNSDIYNSVTKYDHEAPRKFNQSELPFAEQNSSFYNFPFDNDNAALECHDFYNHFLEDDAFNTLSSMDLQKLEEEAPVKKSIMITEEYEALLRSALEEQAQHYEGEITRRIAEISAEEVDDSRISEEEKFVIKSLHDDIESRRQQVEHLSTQLLDCQAQEAGYRAQNKVLLREANIAKACLEQIQNDAQHEQDEYRKQMEELEFQVLDLTNNIKMRRQIAQNYGELLTNAQIFGTSGEESANKRKNSRTKKQHRRKSSRK